MRRDISDIVAGACAPYYPSVSAAMASRKEYFYSWRARGGSIEITLSDYLDGAPDEVLCDVAEMVCRRSKKLQWGEPESFLEYVSDPDFIAEYRPVYIKRSRNLTRSDMGEHFCLMDSVQRLLDDDMLQPGDIENAYMSWTVRDTTRRLGFCSTMFRVVGISSVLDSPDVDDDMRDYVVYHECLHLRQRYSGDSRHHDSRFRSWERAYPDWKGIEARLGRLHQQRTAGKGRRRAHEGSSTIRHGPGHHPQAAMKAVILSTVPDSDADNHG